MRLRDRNKEEITIFAPQYETTYLAMDGYPCPMGECFFVHYTEEVDPTLHKQLTSKPVFREKLTTDAGVLYVFNVPEEEFKTIVRPFMRGEYSKVDREYVTEFFPNDPHSKIYTNRLIFDKSPTMRDYWRYERGVDIPEDAEVYSKMKEADETFRTAKAEVAEVIE